MSASDSYVPNLYADALVVNENRRTVIPREMFRSFMSAGEACADFVVATACTAGAYFLQLHLGYQSGCSLQKIGIASALVGLFVALSLQKHKDGHTSYTLSSIREHERIIRTAIQCQLLLILVGPLLGMGLSYRALLLAFALIPTSLMAEKRLFNSILQRFHMKGYGAHRVVVYGQGETANRVASTLAQSPRHGLYPVAVINDKAVAAVDRTFRLRVRLAPEISANYGPLTSGVLKSLNCDLLIVAAPLRSSVEIAEVIQTAERAKSSVAVLYNPAVCDHRSIEWIDINGINLLSNLPPVAAWHSALIKRIMDVLITSILLLLLTPLFLLIALLIRLDSPGPAFFVQKRVGKNGELFNIFKFRSMHATAPKYEPSPTQSSDLRITRIGRVIRRTSLDELPQLINVLLGNMSLVGPRPEMPFLVERHNAEHRPRLQVNPGISGLWQLSADRAFPIHENTHYDLYYIRNKTLCMDVAILLHTVLFAMRGGV